MSQALAARQKSRGIRYDLSVFREILEKLNNPHLRLPPCVLIAGTNGKGSTTAFLAAALTAAGLKVGTYTSPHLVSYNERVQINHTPILTADFDRYFAQIQQVSNALTEFEQLTAMAFLYFVDQSPDIVLFEVGLGGRLDATNVVNPELCIITKIGQDHGAILGNTLAKIAAEKAGIIKPKIPVLSIETQAKSVQKILNQIAKNNQSPLTWVPPATQLPANCALQGEFQKENIALARAALPLLSVWKKEKIKSYEAGLLTPRHWGRFMEYSPNVVVDAAHNLPGIRALIYAAKQKWPKKKPTVFASFWGPKDGPQMLQLLLNYAEKVIVCQPDETFWSYEDLKKAVIKINKKVRILNLEKGPTNFKLDSLNPCDQAPILITGSIYFLGEILRDNTRTGTRLDDVQY